jgi:SAM-dependent methyltransferase
MNKEPLANEATQYFIKAGYRTNVIAGQKSMPMGGDTVEDSHRYQYKVYQTARSLIIKNQLTSVLDLGCGVGMKLAELIYPVCTAIAGVDEPATIAQCKRLHRFGQWYDDNLESPALNLGRTYDLIIAADVIEHLVNPDRLLLMIRKHASEKTWIIISTVERDGSNGPNDMGPPVNSHHAREWNLSEFRKYIESRGFHIIEHFRCDTRRNASYHAHEKVKENHQQIIRVVGVLLNPNRLLSSIRWRFRLVVKRLGWNRRTMGNDSQTWGWQQVMICRRNITDEC